VSPVCKLQVSAVWACLSVFRRGGASSWIWRSERPLVSPETDFASLGGPSRHLQCCALPLPAACSAVYSTAYRPLDITLYRTVSISFFSFVFFSLLRSRVHKPGSAVQAPSGVPSALEEPSSTSQSRKKKRKKKKKSQKMAHKAWIQGPLVFKEAKLCILTQQG